MNDLNWTPVDSSNISQVAFDNGTIYVEFSNGNVYSYEGTTEQDFQNFLSAPSKGKYLNEAIKPRYRVVRIG